MKRGSLLQFTFRPWPHEGPRTMEDQWKTSSGALHSTSLLRPGKPPPPPLYVPSYSSLLILRLIGLSL